MTALSLAEGWQNLKIINYPDWNSISVRIFLFFLKLSLTTGRDRVIIIVYYSTSALNL